MSIRTYFLAALLLSNSALAEVVQRNGNGFVVRHEVTINAANAKVYQALIGQVGAWWNSNHTHSGDAKNLSIDARAGGCFCEKLADGGSVEHMRVIYYAPQKLLRMSGALGPFQAAGVAGSLTWQFADAAGATKLTLTYSIGGFMEGGFERIAPAADAMLAEQLQRLKLFAETGSPVAAK